MALFNNIYSYRHLNGFRTAFCGLVLMLLGIVAFAQTPTFAEEASAPKSYTVKNIIVDVTADNAVEAREKAFEEAQLKGYKMLAERFLSAEKFKSFETPDIKKVASYVKDFEVTNEKLSAVRYKGTYKIRYSSYSFGQEKVATEEATNNNPAIQRGDLLIVPFYEYAGQYALWEANPFMEAWSRARANQTAGKAIVPIGDVNDISAVTEGQGLEYDPVKLNAMRLRYRAKGAVIAVAKPEIIGNGAKSILVSLYKSRAYGPELVKKISVRALPGEVQDQTYNRVVSEVQRTLRMAAKRPMTTQPVVTQQPLSGPVGTITAQLNFSSAREWVETKRAMERARGVQSVQVKSLSPRNAVLGINHQGDIQTLKQSLQQVGVGLHDSVPTAGGAQSVYQLYPTRNVSR